MNPKQPNPPPDPALPKPLNGKPKTRLTEIARKLAEEGWQRIVYRGGDGHTYVAMERNGIQERWMVVPTPSGPAVRQQPRTDLV
jgi:hypothetical protein